MNILRKFAEGDINPGEQRFVNSPKYRKAAKTLTDAEDKFLAALDENQKELFEEFLDAHLDVGALDEAEQFVFGYRLGALMMLDVLTDVDDLTI